MLTDAAFTAAGAQIVNDAAEVWHSDVVVTIAPPDPRDDQRARLRLDPDRLPRAADQPADHTRARRRQGDRVCDGGDPADLARPGDGRAVLPEQRRGLPLRASRRRGNRPLLPDADDRCGNDPAGQGARAGRRRRRPAGDRDRQTPGCAHDRLRRSPRGRRAGRIARRAVARPRCRGQRRGRLRA